MVLIISHVSFCKKLRGLVTIFNRRFNLFLISFFTLRFAWEWVYTNIHKRDANNGCDAPRFQLL